MRALRTIVVAALLASSGTAAAFGQGDAQADDAARLRARYAELAPELEHNAFGRRLHLASEDRAQTMRGDVHAVLEQPYARIHGALAGRQGWCALLVLPFNVKGCELRGDDGLSLYIGRTWDTTLDRATRIDFTFEAAAADEDNLRLRLVAPTGPLGTRDYRIAFSAVPLDAGHTLVHLSYGYGYGILSRLAMQTYLATSGAAKVGFSREDDRDGGGHLVHGMRGVLERNTMRYFLAIEAYLETLDAPPEAREERRMAAWFDAAERYPKQLHEMSREEYLAYKKGDFTSPRERFVAH